MDVNRLLVGAGLGVAVLGVAVLGAAGAAAAQEPGEWASTPSEGPAGTRIESLSSTPCPTRDDLAFVQMLDEAHNRGVTTTYALPDPVNRQWQSFLDVPAGTAEGEYELQAWCAPGFNQAPDLFYETDDWAVTEP